MRKGWLLLMTMVVLSAAGCDLAQPGIQGSGKVTTEQRAIAGFSSVKLKGTGRLMIDAGSQTESLSITADDNLLPYLTSEVNGSELVLGTKDGTNVVSSKDIVYKLSAKDLNVIDLGGSGSIDAKGIHTDRLKVTLGGSGTISMAGVADQQEIMLAGSGDYTGNDLKSKSATITIAGSGNAEVNATDKLGVNIMGSGSVRYSGDPTVSKQILGSGSVEKR